MERDRPYGGAGRRMIPALPAAAIREAVANGDWDTADALLSAHETELRAACLEESPAEARCRESWIELLGAQRALIEELRSARDEAGAALERLGRERRGVAAYTQGDG